MWGHTSCVLVAQLLDKWCMDITCENLLCVISNVTSWCVHSRGQLWTIVPVVSWTGTYTTLRCCSPWSFIIQTCAPSSTVSWSSRRRSILRSRSLLACRWTAGMLVMFFRYCVTTSVFQFLYLHMSITDISKILLISITSAPLSTQQPKAPRTSTVAVP